MIFRGTYLGIKLFLRHDLGHSRVESNLRTIPLARATHGPLEEIDSAYLFLGHRIHERLDTLEKSVYPPSEENT